MRFTVLGSSGFIGSHLLEQFRQSGHECLAPGRDDPSVFGEDLGHVIYCIGLTADFRSRPFDTVQAHVCYLSKILEHARFTSLLYLSSTRVYAGAARGDEEEALLAGDIYNVSKLTGEALCFSCENRRVRVARLSNVVGEDFASQNFIASLVREAVTSGRVALQTTLGSAKDYVVLKDVLDILPAIALYGRHRLYNVAGGRNISNYDWAEALEHACGCVVEEMPGAREVVFPAISVGRLEQEFNYSPSCALGALPALIDGFRCRLEKGGK